MIYILAGLFRNRIKLNNPKFCFIVNGMQKVHFSRIPVGPASHNFLSWVLPNVETCILNTQKDTDELSSSDFFWGCRLVTNFFILNTPSMKLF